MSARCGLCGTQNGTRVDEFVNLWRKASDRCLLTLSNFPNETGNIILNPITMIFVFSFVHRLPP